MKEKKYFLLKGIVIIAVFLITLIPILLECHKVEPAEEPANKLGQESVGKAVTAKEPAQKTGKTTGSTDKKTGLANHVVTGYWQNFDNDARCLKISDVPKGYNLVAVAFAEATSVPGKVTFQLDETLCQRLGGYSKKQFIKDIKAAKKKRAESGNLSGW